jgi:hypothetical protein
MAGLPIPNLASSLISRLFFRARLRPSLEDERDPYDWPKCLLLPQCGDFFHVTRRRA